RANVYPNREFLSRGRREAHNKTCRHCPGLTESCAHIIGYCPRVQEARIKRHNIVCKILADEAKKKDWKIYIEPLIRNDNNDLFKLDLIIVKDGAAMVIDVTIRYESTLLTLKEAAMEKVKKYEHLKDQIKDLTGASIIRFFGFPLGARGKWYDGNSDVLSDIGLSQSRVNKTAIRLSNLALFSSVDIVHIFTSSA
ncbi:hypothetical protein N303_00488, partial [Cuculus canorus]